MLIKTGRKIHRKLVIRPGETGKYVIQRNKPVTQCPKCGRPGKLRYVKHGRKGSNVGRYYPCVVHYDGELYAKRKSAYKRGERTSRGNGTVVHYYHWWNERDGRYTKRPIDVTIIDPDYWWRPEYTLPEEVKEDIKRGRLYNRLHRLKPLEETAATVVS